MRTLLNIFLAMTVLVGIMGLARPAAAQDVKIQVRSIVATDHGDSVDSSLSDVKSQLQSAFDGYTSFRLLDDTEFSLSQAESHSVELPGGTVLTLRFNGVSEKFLRLGLSIGDQLRTTLRASSGSTFFQAGLDYKSGMLILAITATLK